MVGGGGILVLCHTSHKVQPVFAHTHKPQLTAYLAASSVYHPTFFSHAILGSVCLCCKSLLCCKAFSWQISWGLKTGAVTFPPPAFLVKWPAREDAGSGAVSRSHLVCQLTGSYGIWGRGGVKEEEEDAVVCSVAERAHWRACRCGGLVLRAMLVGASMPTGRGVGGYQHGPLLKLPLLALTFARVSQPSFFLSPPA